MFSIRRVFHQSSGFTTFELFASPFLPLQAQCLTLSPRRWRRQPSPSWQVLCPTTMLIPPLTIPTALATTSLQMPSSRSPSILHKLLREQPTPGIDENNNNRVSYPHPMTPPQASTIMATVVATTTTNASGPHLINRGVGMHSLLQSPLVSSSDTKRGYSGRATGRYVRNNRWRSLTPLDPSPSCYMRRTQRSSLTPSSAGDTPIGQTEDKTIFDQSLHRRSEVCLQKRDPRPLLGSANTNGQSQSEGSE